MSCPQCMQMREIRQGRMMRKYLINHGGESKTNYLPLSGIDEVDDLFLGINW